MLSLHSKYYCILVSDVTYLGGQLLKFQRKLLPPCFVLRIDTPSFWKSNPTKNTPFHNHCLKSRQIVTLWHGLQTALMATAPLSRWFQTFSSMIWSVVGLKRYIGLVFQNIPSLIAATPSSNHQIRILRAYNHIFRK
jgi:hypothetical protein